MSAVPIWRVYQIYIYRQIFVRRAKYALQICISICLHSSRARTEDVWIINSHMHIDIATTYKWVMLHVCVTHAAHLHDTCTCVTWVAHVCNMTHLYVVRMSMCMWVSSSMSHAKKRLQIFKSCLHSRHDLYMYANDSCVSDWNVYMNGNGNEPR